MIILSLILSISNSNHTQKHKYLLEKSFLLEGEKTTEETLNQFHYYQINYNIFCVCLMVKENLSSFFFFFFFFFFALTYILFVFYKCDNTLLSPSWLSPQRRQPFALFSLAISPLRRQPFALSSFAIFSKAATLYSLLLGYSHPKIHFFSLLISHSIFPLPIGRTLGLKPSNFLQHDLFIRLHFIFSLRLGTHYFFNKK